MYSKPHITLKCNALLRRLTLITLLFGAGDLGTQTLMAQGPSVTRVNPNSGQQGKSSLSVTITGTFTHFAVSSAVTFSGSGITAGTPTAATATSLTVPVSIAVSAPLGPQGIQVVTDGETASLANAFRVTAGTPAITLLSPNSAQQGTTALPVTIPGNFTHFTATSVVTFGAGVTAGAPTAATATSLTVPVTIAANATVGTQSIKVVSGPETVSLTNAFSVIGKPVITKMTPNTGQQGDSSLSVTITGTFTHFAVSSVVTFSGSGITAGTPTAATATSLTVPVSIAVSAPPGAQGIQVVTGGETASLANAFTVTAGTPAITLLSPNSAQQGTVSLPVTITGDFTHFTATSVVTFGTGVTAGAPTAATATSLTVPVTIAANATAGTQSIKVVSGPETVSLTNAFTVIGKPVITKMSPNTGPQGDSSLSVTITGTFTHFAVSSVVTFSGSGITVGAPTAATATSLTVPVSIAVTAPLGAQGIQVVTGGETASLANAFTVTAGTPAITLLSPNSAQQGTTALPVTITGNFTHFTATSVVTFGTGVTAGAPTAATATSLTVPVTIAANATVGTQSIKVVSGPETVSLTNAFSVIGKPVITKVNPNTGPQGDNSLSVTITGTFTHFAVSSVVTFSGSGITAGTPTAATATSLTVPVSIAVSAPLGEQGIQVVTGGETASLANAFTVTAGTPAITLLSPNSAQQGTTALPVTIAGDFTHFTATSVVTFGAGVTAGAPTAATATSLTVPVTVAANATVGKQSVKVVSGPETVSLTNAFSVTSGLPVITNVNPNSGQQGQSSLSVTIGGSFTHFNVSSVVTFSGSGITAGTPTSVTATSLTVKVTIASSAPPGAQGVQVVTGTETASLANAFTVTAGTPAITLINPNSGSQGQISLPVTISGSFTHFTATSVVTFSGSGLTAGTPAAATATSLTVPVTIAANASLGAQAIQVVSGTETVSLANAFAVIGTPLITLVNPNSGQQGQSLAVTVSGISTHFVAASVVTFSGTGVTAGAPTAATATSLTVPVTIAANAPLGAQGIQVVSGLETVSLANAFTVTAAAPSSVSYTYDSQGRLASTTYSSSSGSVAVTYSYDPAGNRTSVVTK